MNKKLVKTRVGRTNTLEAMACTCVCICVQCTPTNCSGGGSFQVTEGPRRRTIEHNNVSAINKK